MSMTAFSLCSIKTIQEEHPVRMLEYVQEHGKKPQDQMNGPQLEDFSPDIPFTIGSAKQYGLFGMKRERLPAPPPTSSTDSASPCCGTALANDEIGSIGYVRYLPMV